MSNLGEPKILKNFQGRLFFLFLLILIGLSCSKFIPSLIGEKDNKEMVNLPSDVRGADIDYDLEKESSMISTLTSENKLYQEQNQFVSNRTKRTENITSKEELPEKLKKFSEIMSPDKKIVYLKTDVNTTFENVLQIFQIIRDAKINKVGLVVLKKNAEPDKKTYRQFEVKLPENFEKSDYIVRPNPLTLVAMLETDGKLSLNREDMGMISNTEQLETLLANVFKERENNGVFREGTNEIEKTVFIRISKSNKYSDFIKLVDAVKLAGSQPIAVKTDDDNNYIVR